MTGRGFLDLIEIKKEGRTLSTGQIRFWIEGVVDKTIPDYQSAALLMAIRLKGMTFEETLALTEAMADSGERLRYEAYPVVFDKHSTGGIGDKVTLVLAPLVAACGLPVAMLSGRSLGHTGGTIDKFESLPGVSCNQDFSRMALMLDRFGWANIEAGDTIDPADRILYGLRDVTSTVDSIPLITASILSKKLAGGATHLILDVKCGHGAFMEDLRAARELTSYLKRIGTDGGLTVSGFITRMEEPLGHAIGNYLELLESVDYLRERRQTPLMDLILKMGAEMLQQAKLAASHEAALAAMTEAISSGRALERLAAYLDFCGAQPAVLEHLLRDSLTAYSGVPITAAATGKLTAIDGRMIGERLVGLGAGRKRVEDIIDPLAGMVLNKHLGEGVEKGEVLAWLHGRNALAAGQAGAIDFLAAFHIGGTAGPPQSLILETI